ncbi:transmembrane protein 6/97 [Lineolata rhizophorae]|uniref:Transmembrane protein 6/97 n=1 Tax=Lineolata rhizophorae TaxID=578093 RepID=A0A6A6NLZ4_9PEZI|nr:transmembrane protein 6/97 [Lineolata rhizophorae]
MASIWTRKTDLAYLLFFLLHIPIMLVVDFAPLYPDAIKPIWMDAIRQVQIDNYHDRFFSSPPAWFGAYVWMEALFHLPFSVWAIGALVRDDSKLPLGMLIFGCQTFFTTFTCIADFLSWEDYSLQEKIDLGTLYVPYLALGKGAVPSEPI